MAYKSRGFNSSFVEVNHPDWVGLCATSIVDQWPDALERFAGAG